MTTPGLEAVAALVAAAGVGGRRLREAIQGLTEGPRSLDDLIRDTALPRRTVEALLRAAGPDLHEASGGRYALAPRTVIEYRTRFRVDELNANQEGHGLTARLQDLIDAAPAARAALDHVSATAETATRRALWLDSTFDLAGAHLLLVGDHDLTSLAVALLRDDCRISVVDVDDRLLEYLDKNATTHRRRIDVWHADLRFGLPPLLADSADLIFTDPPYTPSGVQLFLGRGMQALRDRTNGRLLLSYGFSPLTPAIGVKVQKAVLDLDLAIEAILPDFNRYHGAQAVGSASDLYVCRPTARTWQILDRRLDAATVNVYTRGGQAEEGGPAAGRDELAALFDGSLRSPEVTANLADDPGSWLVRALLSVNAQRVELVVPNHHPDLADAAAQAALRELLAAKYTLKMRRSTPGPKLATVEASAVSDAGGTDGGIARWLLTHAHGKVGNVLRDALIRRDPTLTKNAARALAADLVPRELVRESRLLDLPRHAIGPTTRVGEP